jgi:aldose 1-epimerase
VSVGGAEYVLENGPYRAVITQVGGGLRALQHHGRDLVRPYRPDEVRPRYAGALLAPWPNRIADGRYVFDGETHQLPINEPERGTALHGLVLWDRFEVAQHVPASVTLRDVLVPRVGYPFELEVQVRYELDQVTGLRTVVRGRNTGRRPAPWAAAAHPYVQAGTPRIDECHLAVPAARVLEVTHDRLLPVRQMPVDGTELDLRRAQVIGGRYIDHAYTGLLPEEDGFAHVRLLSGDGTGVQCTWDPGPLPWLQIHTADTPDPATNRTGLAVEPMTCAPDAFNSGEGLLVLQPDEEHVVSWTVGALRTMDL